MNYSFQKLTRELYESLRHNFNSGNDVVDNFINTTECLDLGIGVTYIALDDENLMMAYYNVSTGCVVDTSNNLKVGGSIHLNKFGLDKAYQGFHIGPDDSGLKLSDVLFCKIVDYIISMREYIWFSFITLCSTKEGLHLYQRSGFEPIDEDMIIIQDESENGCYQMYYSLDIE